MDGIKIEWSLPEYDHKEKTSDWFKALGIIVVAGALTSLIYGNIFFAMILVLGGIMMWYFGKKQPDIVSYELNEKGLIIKDRLFPYDTIKAFFVVKEPKPKLFFKSSRPFMPIISLPIEEDRADQIKKIMLEKNVPEQEMREHVSEHIMDAIGF